jgi:hypothetical protein
MNCQTQVALPLLMIALGWAGGAWAAGDPTEAPPVWVAAQSGARGAASMATSVVGPAVQVILSGRSRRVAVIDGEVLKVGDQYKGSKIVDIRANEVVMEDAAKSLVVTPDVEKTAPVVSKVKKKSVVIPEGNVSSTAQ